MKQRVETLKTEGKVKDARMARFMAKAEAVERLLVALREDK